MRYSHMKETIYNTIDSLFFTAQDYVENEINDNIYANVAVSINEDRNLIFVMKETNYDNKYKENFKWKNK